MIVLKTVFAPLPGDPDGVRAASGGDPDEFRRISGNDMTSVLYAWAIAQYGGQLSAQMAMTMGDVAAIGSKREACLLQSLLSELDVYGSSQMVGGWKMYQEVWPRLMLRIISHSLKVPQILQWAVLDPVQKWQGRGFWDFHTVYTQGASGRPDIDLSDALYLWTGAITPSDMALCNMPPENCKKHMLEMCSMMLSVAEKYG